MKQCGNCKWYKNHGEGVAENECMYWPIPEASYNYTEPMLSRSNNGDNCPCWEPIEENNNEPK